jgi:hypothetical protein
MAGIMSAGQFAVASVLVLPLLGPVFGFNDKGGALNELSFAGGHGTLAGLGPLLDAYGRPVLLTPRRSRAWSGPRYLSGGTLASGGYTAEVAPLPSER